MASVERSELDVNCSEFMFNSHNPSTTQNVRHDMKIKGRVNLLYLGMGSNMNFDLRNLTLNDCHARGLLTENTIQFGTPELVNFAIDPETTQITFLQEPKFKKIRAYRH